MARIKNFLTPQWMKEFEELKRQAADEKRRAASIKPKGSSFKPQAKLDKSNKQEVPDAEAQASSPRKQAP